MVLTDWKEEILEIRRSEGITWQEIADKCGATRQGIRSVVKGTENIIPKSIVRILEVMGYDIEIEFIRK